MNVHTIKSKYTAQLRIRVVHTDIRLAVLTAFHHAAYAPRPTAKVPALDCTDTAPLTKPDIASRRKVCRRCAVYKPLVEFSKYDGRGDRRRAMCKVCEHEAEHKLIAKARKKAVPSGVPVHKLPAPKACDALGNDEEDQDLFYLGTKGGPVTLDVLQAYARSMPGTRVVFTCGTTRVDAVYAGASNDFDYAYGFGSWPVDADYLSRVFDQLNSGRTAGGFW